MSNAIFGSFSVSCALIGLILASGALDDGMYVFGLALFAFGCLFAFFLMKNSFDAEDAARDQLPGR